MDEQEFVLDGVSVEDYEAAGSKFVTFPAGAKVGDTMLLNLELGLPDWDTPGQSLKFPVTITEEGQDQGKEDKISAGVSKEAIFKLKDFSRNVLGKDLEMKNGHPVFKPTEWVGKPAKGEYTMTEGKKGGVGERVVYPKLTSLYPADYVGAEETR